MQLKSNVLHLLESTQFQRMSSVNSFQRHVRLSVWTTNSAFTVTLLFYIHPQYTYQPPKMNVLILLVHYEVHSVVLSMNYISIITTSSSHIRGYSILLVEIRMSTRWSILMGLSRTLHVPRFLTTLKLSIHWNSLKITNIVLQD